MGRVRSIDAVRGLAMGLMALDHLRDFLGDAHFDATDLTRTTVPLFAARWVTHFCAPTFFLLSGASTALSIRSGRRTVPAAARFLATRGLALVVVEQTLLKCLGWYFHLDYHFMNAGVLYGLGLSMLLLAPLLALPSWVSLGLGTLLVLGEAGLARLQLPGLPGTLLALATQSRDFEPVPGYHFFVSYPPLPWAGAMLLGFGLTPLAHLGEGARPRVLVATGAGALALFGVLRWLDVLEPSTRGSGLPWPRAVLDFVNLSKYPPSTPFLLLTLGVALLALAAAERWPAPGRLLEDFGRVPLFFYLLHIPLIHLLAVAYSLLVFGDASWLTSGPVVFWDTALPGSPASYGLGLGWLALVWGALLVGLHPVCRWYAARVR